MKPITYYLNFPLARQIQDCLDRLSPDQAIELAFAIGQRALDERRSADIVRIDIEGIPIVDVDDCPDLPTAIDIIRRAAKILDKPTPVEMSIEEDDNYPDFPCDDFLTSPAHHKGATA